MEIIKLIFAIVIITLVFGGIIYLVSNKLLIERKVEEILKRH